MGENGRARLAITNLNRIAVMLSLDQGDVVDYESREYDLAANFTLFGTDSKLRKRFGYGAKSPILHLDIELMAP